MPGLDGMARMAAIMKRLHDAPLTEVAGTPVTLQKDYLTGQMTVPGQAAEPMELKDSDVVAYDLADGSTFVRRRCRSMLLLPIPFKHLHLKSY